MTSNRNWKQDFSVFEFWKPFMRNTWARQRVVKSKLRLLLSSTLHQRLHYSRAESPSHETQEVPAKLTFSSEQNLTHTERQKNLSPPHPWPLFSDLPAVLFFFFLFNFKSWLVWMLERWVVDLSKYTLFPQMGFLDFLCSEFGLRF